MARPELPPPALLDPGWYPDPTGRYEARFWDGRTWTGNISHYGATGTDPLRRSRWDDRLRPRWLFQLIGFLLVAGAVAGAVLYFWPNDDRNRDTDRMIAQGAALTLDDLPADWAEAQADLVSALGDTNADESADDDADASDDDAADDAPDDNAPDNAADDELEGEPEADLRPDVDEACAHFDDHVGLLDEPLETTRFGDASGLQTISNRVIVAEDVDDATDYLVAMREERTGDCLIARLIASVVSGESGLTNTSAELLDAPAFGEEAVWWRLTGTVSGFLPIQINADIVVVRSDRGVAEFTFAGQIERVGVATQRDSLRPVAIRLAAAIEAAAAETADGNSEDG